MKRFDGAVMGKEEQYTRAIRADNPFLAREKIVRCVGQWVWRTFELCAGLPRLPAISLGRSNMLGIPVAQVEWLTLRCQPKDGSQTGQGDNCLAVALFIVEMKFATTSIQVVDHPTAPKGDGID